MRVLHICNDYCGSKVHLNLYQKLAEEGVEQTVYTYFRDAALVGKNKPECERIQVSYRPILKTYHRVLYHLKIRTVAKDLDEVFGFKFQDSGSRFDLVHATTLFSDGPLALHLYKKYGVPYVVTLRNTDINEFLGFAPHTWHKGIEVLRNASKIVFISKAPMEKFCRHIAIKSILDNIRDKFVLQPNGVDVFWLNNVAKEVQSNNQNIIYVGKFDRNKNVKRLMKAVLDLKPQFPELKLNLVGGDASQGGVFSYCKKYTDTFIYHGKIYDKQILRDLYRQCSVFAMPSIHETFGLVYIEALSQHLAVIYTKNQGIDGLLDERVGEKVNALSTKSIKDAIAKILTDRDHYKACEVVDFTAFDWKRIADRYLELYRECLRQ